MAPDVQILKIGRAEGGFVAVPQSDPSSDDSESFTVAMVCVALDAAASRLAFACDFVAVRPDVTLMAVDPRMLRRRAGAPLDAAIEPDGSIRGVRLHALGLAAFLIDRDVETTRERLLKQADTMLAMKQARTVSDPDWFNPR